MTTTEAILRTRIRRLILFFIIALIISGITAFPIEGQLNIAMQHSNLLPPDLKSWLQRVYDGVRMSNQHYPFLAYGTDRLAFAHIVIATAFIGPLQDPVRNIWVVQFGMIACVMVIPLALIAGHIRGVPMFWRLIDCSFGVIGFVPLYIAYKYIKRLELTKEVTRSELCQ